MIQKLSDSISIIIIFSINYYSMDALYIYLPLVLLIFHITSKHIWHKLKNLPPSPFPSLPFIGHLYLLKKPYHRALSEVSKRYGPVLFLQFGSRPVVLVSSPSLADECFTKNDIVFANRPSLLNGKHFGYNWTNLAWCSYGDHWRNLRRIASLDLLSSHRLQMLSQVRADEIRSLIQKLFRLARENPEEIVFVKRALFEFTFNVMTRMICGKRYFGDGVDNSKEAQFFQDLIKETGKVVPEAQVLDVLPFLRWFRFRDTEKKMMLIQEKRDKFMQNVIDEHRRLETDPDAAAREKKNIAEVLLDKQKEESVYYTDEMIKNLLLVLLQAGSDTTATALEWAFSFLLDNQSALVRAQIEIDNIVGKKRLIEESDLVHLPYLHCIINETMRIRPPTPLIFPHESSTGCTVGGFHVPGGTILLVNASDIHSQFWEDPEKFKPERFQDFEKVKNGCKFLPFGLGRRACPGENLALRVVALALGTLIQCFNWEKVNEIDMNEAPGFAAPKIEPLTARCSPRPDVVNLLSQM